MARPQPRFSVTVGDPMARITLPSAAETLFDSFDSATSGMARAYWMGEPPAPHLADALAACETTLHVVAAALPRTPCVYPSWLIDHGANSPRRSAHMGASRFWSMWRAAWRGLTVRGVGYLLAEQKT